MAAAFQSVTCTDSPDYIDCTIGGNDTNFLIIDGDTMRFTNFRTIATPTTSGYQGEICFDASYVYVCTATNTWKRALLTTWIPL
jgi:hypothetical protein